MPSFNSNNNQYEGNSNSPKVITKLDLLLFALRLFIPIVTIIHIKSLFQDKKPKKAIAWICWTVLFWGMLIVSFIAG